MQYYHKQFGTFITAALAVGILLAIFPALITGTFPPILMAVLGVIAVVWVLLYSLSLEIKDNALVCRLGAGLIRRRILLSEIRQISPVSNPWYAGFGIHWVPGQYWLWNVSGRRGVELSLKSGERFRLGTDEPEALIRAIKSYNKGNKKKG
jgi:hypothetical protein